MEKNYVIITASERVASRLTRCGIKNVMRTEPNGSADILLNTKKNVIALATTYECAVAFKIQFEEQQFPILAFYPDENAHNMEPEKLDDFLESKEDAVTLKSILKDFCFIQI